MDEDTKGTKLALGTEGDVLSEEEVRELGKHSEIDYPMPGEPVEDSGSTYHMPDSNLTVIDEDGKEV